MRQQINRLTYTRAIPGRATLHGEHMGIYTKSCAEKHEYYVKKAITHSHSRDSLPAILLTNYGEEMYDLYREETRNADPHSPIFKYWSHIDNLKEVFLEGHIGTACRFYVSEYQPKTRIECVNHDLYVASKSVRNQGSLARLLRMGLGRGVGFHNQVYLKHYPAIMLFRLLLGDTDFHKGQILLDGNVAVSIDFGNAGEPQFNSNDIRHLPFVGKNGGKGGIHDPMNWMGIYANTLQSDYTNAILRWDAVHQNDPRTYKNPRFQSDINYSLLQLLLIPNEELLDELGKQNEEIASAKMPGSRLPEYVSRFVKKRMLRGLQGGIEKSAEIPNFREYLKNITLFELVKVAKEFHRFMEINQPKKKEKKPAFNLEVLWGNTPESIFDNCLKNLTRALTSPLFGLSPEEMPLQLRFFESLSEDIKNEFIRNILREEGAPSPEDFMHHYCRMDHLLRMGNLTADSNVDAINIPADFPMAEFMKSRLNLMRRVIEGQKLLRKVLNDFDLKKFKEMLHYIAHPTDINPEDILACGSVQDGRIDFLNLDGMSLQRIINHYFAHEDNYEEQCIALHLVHFFRKVRNEKIESLQPAEYEKLSTFATTASSKKLSEALLREFPLNPHLTQEGVIRNGIEWARKNPNRTQQKQIKLVLFDLVAGNPGFFLTHVGFEPRCFFKEISKERKSTAPPEFKELQTDKNNPAHLLISLMINLEFNPKLIESLDHVDRSYLFLLIKYYLNSEKIAGFFQKNLCSLIPEMTECIKLAISALSDQIGSHPFNYKTVRAIWARIPKIN